MDSFRKAIRIPVLAMLLIALTVSGVAGQSGSTCKKWKSASVESMLVSEKTGGDRSFSSWRDRAEPGVDSEKSILVNKNVYLSFCVTGAPVKVSGWKRSEVRLFVKGRADIGFKVRETSRKDDKPVWVELFAGESPSRGERLDTCLSGDSVELDVPVGASITISGTSGESSIEIDSVRRAKIDISSGDVSLSHIGGGIEAQTDVGGVSVRNSSGKMYLKTTAGNIVAFRTQTNEIGDYFKAKTNSGAITMQSIEQKEVEASSLSGSISFVGETNRNGDYSFSTTNGIITLAIPVTSSFKLKAAYGGSFYSELPLTKIFKNATPSVVLLTGIVGRENGATVSVRSFSGTIKILEIGGEARPNPIP